MLLSAIRASRRLLDVVGLACSIQVPSTPRAGSLGKPAEVVWYYPKNSVPEA